MKYLTIITIFLISTITVALSQDSEFTVEINPSEVLMHNYFEVKFTLKNAKGRQFSPPNFQDFKVIAGPNQSSSFSMVNGTVDQSQSYSFYLEPTLPGTFFIESATIEVDGNILESTPTEVVVLENPDGIKQEIPQEKQHFEFDSFFDFPFGMEKEKPAPKPKKKRKVYKM